jgi:nucleotide-binding universal stress UspA family protein
MRPIRHVLVPVDFSDLSRGALAYGATLARGFDARLTALYVSPFYLTPEPWRAVSMPLLDSEQRRTMEQDLRDFTASACSGNVGMNTIVREGDPAQEILRYASSTRADLIVLGTHGRRGFQRWVVGSVTNRVARNADCLVVAVPPWPAEKGSARVLCAVDLSESSNETLERAAAFARAMSAHLTVLYVVDGPHGFEPWVLKGQTEAEARAELIEAARESLAQRTVHYAWGLSTEVRVIAGQPPEEIERALGHGIDLAVIGVRPSSGIDRFFYGSTAQHVLRSALCPLLLVPHAPVGTEQVDTKAAGASAPS